VAQLLVFNKVDALANDQQPRLLQDVFVVDGVAIPRIFVSAQTGANLDGLRQRLMETALQVSFRSLAPCVVEVNP
jgi:GTP-binding protein HflX